MGTTKKALVLSGGSIKGAFQAGAIKAILEKGFKPDFISGISVGSLNATYITHEAGIQNKPVDELDWAIISDHLINFWIEKIYAPKCIATKKGKLELGIDILFSKFEGFLDTSPIQKLVKKSITMDNLYKSPVKLSVGCVNISDGEITYANPAFPNFLDYVLASTAIPITMPLVKIGGNENQLYTDGGIRDVAPLKQAIENGVDEIICVCCQSEKLGGEVFNHKSIMAFSERIMDIVVNETVNNDIGWTNFINDYTPIDGSPVTGGAFAGYRRIKLTIIRPSKPINVNLENFTIEDIKGMINNGYYTALEALK